MKGLYILEPWALERIYGPPEREEIARRVEIVAPPQTKQSVKENPSVLREAEAIFSGWGAPRMDGEFLAAAPNLRVVFYGSGSIHGIVTDAFWERSILITSAWAANAVPVAEYALSQILWCLKRGWHYVLTAKAQRRLPEKVPVPGAYGSTVGLVALGMIGRRVCGLLRHFDVRVVAYDPYVTDEQARQWGAERVSLEELFRICDVVSLHAPRLEETKGLIAGRHFESMKPGAAFINTARGAVVREAEMIEVLRRRPDLIAVLDVTDPEPPQPSSPLYELPNVVLTPHIAGSMDAECRRMGRYMVEELRRYVAGQPLEWAVDRRMAERLA